MVLNPLRRTFWSAALERPYEKEREKDGDGRRVVALEEANCVSSLLEDGRHAPLLDLDVPHTYVPSSTPGHGHLIIDVPMSWKDYQRLLKELALAGILEAGYVNAALSRGHNELRLPTVTKPTPDDEPPY